jgi:hypothetical protein
MQAVGQRAKLIQIITLAFFEIRTDRWQQWQLNNIRFPDNRWKTCLSHDSNRHPCEPEFVTDNLSS